MPHSLTRLAVNRIASPATGVLACAGLLLLSGCGGKGVKLGEVSGQVTFNGEPLPKAVVAFEPLGGGRPSIGQTDDQGRYELIYLRDIRGALVGKHRVKIGKEGGPAARGCPISTIRTPCWKRKSNRAGTSLTSP